MNETHRSAAFFTLALLAFAACGGGDPVQGPTEAGEPVPLDFSAIAGQWEGTWALGGGQEGYLVADLNASAVARTVVGTAEWLDGARNLESRVDWIAVSANPPSYTVEEEIMEGTGAEGFVFLDHDPETGTLAFRFEAFEGGAVVEGTMTRTN